MASNIEKEKKRKLMRKYYIIIGGVFYVLFSIAFLRFTALRAADPRLTISEGINKSIDFFYEPFCFFHIPDGALYYFMLTTVAIALFGFMYWTDRQLKKHDNPETVNGEAHLMTAEELKEYNLRFSSPIGKPENNGPNNMIISKDIRLAIDNRGTRRNCNILVIGGSGAGKSRFFASPNILQYNCNFVITDPSGELLHDYGKALEDHGYAVKVFNLTDVYRSNRYNPFHYIKEEKDVFTLVNTLIKNTTPPDGHAGDPFWENSEKLLLTALILYLWHMHPEEEQTFTNVLKLLNAAKINENDETAESPLDILFNELEPNNAFLKVAISYLTQSNLQHSKSQSLILKKGKEDEE